MADHEVPGAGPPGKPLAEPQSLSEADIGAFLDPLKPAQRKAWLMEKHADGLLGDDQVAFWFYVYALREA